MSGYKLNSQRYPGLNESLYHTFLDQIVKSFNEELPQDLLSDIKYHYLLTHNTGGLRIRDPKTIKRPKTMQEER